MAGEKLVPSSSPNEEEITLRTRESNTPPPRERSIPKHTLGQSEKSFYREIQRIVIDPKDTGSSASKHEHERRKKGAPLTIAAENITQEALREARREVRDLMLQYTKCSDPTEREARKERMRQAEVSEQMEEAALQLARAASAISEENQRALEQETTPNRMSATKRLGPINHQEVDNLERSGT